MLPIEIPPGTTVETLFTQVVPEFHRRFVTERSKEAIVVCARVDGGPSYTMTVRGPDIDVEEGEDKASIWVHMHRSAIELFLADWSRFVPKGVPPGGLVMLTDPRILRRVVMVSSKLELALTDFPGHGRLAMSVATGEQAKRGIDPDSPDVTIEAKTALLEEILSGRLPPEEALSAGRVTVKGKMMLAMQLAFAVAPFYPAKK
jgi:putative sterol carrier protein